LGVFFVAGKFLLEGFILECGPDEKKNYDDKGRYESIQGTEGKREANNDQDDSPIHWVADIFVRAFAAYGVSPIFLNPHDIGEKGVFLHCPECDPTSRNITDKGKYFCDKRNC